MTEPIVTHKFEAEVSQVLKLVINSLYSNKEIFLRELLSNASDALDRLRFRAITEPELLGSDPTLEIRIRADKEKNALIIEDTGVGMTEAELIKNLGTVAHSGTRSFIEKLGDAKKDLNVIGQFGVGFYSAFLVADRVEVITRAAGPDEKALRWASEAKDSFTVEPATRAERGTELWLHLRDDQKQYLEEWTLRDLVTKYSDYVAYPIKLETTRSKKDAEGKDITETSLEQVNRASALWQRPKSEITDAQYDDLYQHLTHDFEPPMARTHFRVEGAQEFVGLLYIPKRKPWDLGDPSRRRGVRLFVKRVFIMDDCEEILAPYLRFVRGVIDSDDLPLNVSRELLQDSSFLKVIRKNVTKKIIDLLSELAKDRNDDYLAFWKEFGSILKEGLVRDGDAADRDKLLDLLRFDSTRVEGGKLTSLAEYVARMPEGQKEIYYLTGPSRSALVSSPYLEALEKRGYEVILMTDTVDEWAGSAIEEYKGKKLVSAMRADLSLTDTEEQKKEKEEKGVELKELMDRMKTVLDKHVKEVRISDRLTDSPCCLVIGSHDATSHMEKLMKEHGQFVPHAKRILEINAGHPFIQNLKKEAASERAGEWIETLYEQAVLSEGGTLDDPNRFARRIAKLLTDVSSQATA